jgi:shikimate dehydrogenase
VTPTARTRVAGVIGSPVRHSLSPVIHNAAFAAHGDDWIYCAFEVDPLHAVAAIDAMRVLGIAGLSVTMPHKEMVIPALDVVDASATLVRAVNTVVRDAEGRLVGHNTDGTGCVDALGAAGADLAHVAVIGAGATARAVVAALAAGGSRVRVANRTPSRRDDAVAVGNAVRPGSTEPIDVARVGECATIINTTPQGMSGVAADALPFDTSALRARHCVLDAVYHPLETRLVREARGRGAKVVDGLDMLCAQAALQQRLWLRRRPDVELMRRAALGELAKQQR